MAHKKEQEEHATWVDAIRNTGENLGTFIARKMESREPMGEPPEPQQVGESRVRKYREPARPPGRSRGEGKGKAKVRVDQPYTGCSTVRRSTGSTSAASAMQRTAERASTHAEL